MSPVVSIIVPVYNAAATLPRCADSILDQEFTDFELLLAEDYQRLSGQELIGVEERKEQRDRTLRVTLLDGAEDILTDLLAAQNDYEQLCRADLTDEETAQYAALHARVMARVRDALW